MICPPLFFILSLFLAIVLPVLRITFVIFKLLLYRFFIVKRYECASYTTRSISQNPYFSDTKPSCFPKILFWKWLLFVHDFSVGKQKLPYFLYFLYFLLLLFFFFFRKSCFFQPLKKLKPSKRDNYKTMFLIYYNIILNLAELLLEKRTTPVCLF